MNIRPPPDDEANVDVVMNQILPGLWDVDEIGDEVNCYLWEGNGGVTLVDTGLPNRTGDLLTAITNHGYPWHMVNRVLITHVDMDHTGGLLKVKQATRARIACHAVEKEFMERPHKRKPAALWLRPPLWFARQLPNLRLHGVSPDELYVDGDITPEGFTVVHTPGHTPGHIALLHREKRLLIAGDALSNRKGKLSPPPAQFTPDQDNALRSIWKLAKKYADAIDTIVFGHGPPILRNGGHRIKALASQLFAAEI